MALLWELKVSAAIDKKGTERSSSGLGCRGLRDWEALSGECTHTRKGQNKRARTRDCHSTLVASTTCYLLPAAAAAALLGRGDAAAVRVSETSSLHCYAHIRLYGVQQLQTMSAMVSAANERKVLSEPTDRGGTRAALSDSDDEDDRLRQRRMKEVMQQTESLQPAGHHSQPASAAHSADPSSTAVCTHCCPRCCPSVSRTARRVTFPFLDGEWLLRPVGDRVARAAVPRTAAYMQPPAALPSSHDSSIATVARSRLHARLSQQLDCDQHIWPDIPDEMQQRSEADDSIDWTQLVAGTRSTAEEQDNAQQAAAAAAVDMGALSSRERRKLKRKHERQVSTAAKHSIDTNET